MLAVIKELVQLLVKFALRKTKAIKPVATAVFRNHTKSIPVILDVFVLVSGAGVFIWSFAHNQPATTRFVAATELLCVMVVGYSVALRRDWRRFRPQSAH